MLSDYPVLMKLLLRGGCVAGGLVFLLSGCQEVPTEALRFVQLEIEAPTTVVDVGDTLSFAVSAVSSGGARLELIGLNWRTSDPTIATAVDGRVSGLLPGRTYVHAYVSGISDSLPVTVRTAPLGGGRASPAALSDCWAQMVLEKQLSSKLCSAL